MFKERFYFSLLACVLFLLATADFSQAQVSIDATGGWGRAITAGDLQAGAGSDLISTYESITNAGMLTISGTSGNSDTWRVDVRRSDTNWHSDFILLVKRTGDGIGGGSISGGTVYQAIGPSDNAFFSGAGDRSNIPLQFELKGMSIQVEPGTYSTTVIYTVIDT